MSRLPRCRSFRFAGPGGCGRGRYGRLRSRQGHLTPILSRRFAGPKSKESSEAIPINVVGWPGPKHFSARASSTVPRRIGDRRSNQICLGQEARKPIFKLASTVGAIGSHVQAVVEAHNDFKGLAEKLLEGMMRMKSIPRKPQPIISDRCLDLPAVI